MFQIPMGWLTVNSTSPSFLPSTVPPAYSLLGMKPRRTQPKAQWRNIHALPCYRSNTQRPSVTTPAGAKGYPLPLRDVVQVRTVVSGESEAQILSVKAMWGQLRG